MILRAIVFVIIGLLCLIGLSVAGDPKPLLIDDVTPAGPMMLCEKRALPGKQHTLNPHAPPDKQRQEVIKVCVEVLPNGQPPSSRPFIVTAERAPRSIA